MLFLVPDCWLHQLQLRHHPAPWRALRLYGTAKETRPCKGTNFVKFAIAQSVTIIYGYASYLPGAVRRRLQMQPGTPEEKWLCSSTTTD